MKQPAILVFRIGSLGDTIVSVPALRWIRTQHPEARILLLTNVPIHGGVKAAASYAVLAGSDLVDGYFEYPIGAMGLKAMMALAGRIRTAGVTQAYYLMPALRTWRNRLRDRLFFLASGVWRVRGLGLGKDRSDNRPQPESQRFEAEGARLLRMIGGQASADRLGQADFALGLSQSDRDNAADGLALGGLSGPFVAISVGTKIDVNDWGQDRWIDMLSLLSARLPTLGLMLLGSGDERARCDDLAKVWKGPTLNMCGKVDPRGSAALLERAALFIGHDSGPMHLANSAGIPVVGIFATRQRRGVWFPVGNEDNVFYREIACGPCGRETCVDRMKACIRSITPEEVAERAGQLVTARRTKKIVPVSG